MVRSLVDSGGNVIKAALAEAMVASSAMLPRGIPSSFGRLHGISLKVQSTYISCQLSPFGLRSSSRKLFPNGYILYIIPYISHSKRILPVSCVTHLKYPQRSVTTCHRSFQTQECKANLLSKVMRKVPLDVVPARMVSENYPGQILFE